jgi:chromosomal replication initiator protein
MNQSQSIQSLAESASCKLAEPTRRRITIRNIQDAVCREFGIGRVDLVSDCRFVNLVKARHVAMLLARELTDQTLPQIGRAFNRNHSSVSYGIDRARRRIAAGERYGEASLAEYVEAVKANLMGDI